MAKESGNPAGKRPSSRNAKPYDANNSFVRKMATKVTDFIPQSSWISKWFNTSQGNEDTLEDRENAEEIEFEDDVQQPPNKRARIRMDVIHPPGTFSIQTRAKHTLKTIEPSTEQYPVHNEMTEDFLEPATAGPSGISHLISSTPAVQADIRAVTSHRSDLNSLASSTNNGITNGMDDNSESSESTSGCSSLIPQINRHEGPSNLYNSTFSSRKRHIDDKLTFTNHLQSPRSLFLDSNSRDTLSSRRPSFNASIITNTLDRASPLSSPFYSGNTTFGGANTAGLYKRSRNFFSNSNELQLKVPRRTNVEVKPSNAAVDSSGMSQTAKKILEALEHFSSPISDAKKIPLKNTNNAVSSVMNRKRQQEEIASPSARIGLRHLTRELTVPTVPDILKLRRRQKLQDTTLVARKIVSARSDPPPSQDYRLRTEDTDNEKYRGKLKGKSKINLEQEETVVPVNLPNIPLPITTLPHFDFTLPPPAPHFAGRTVANKENTFTFASPIKVTEVEKSLQSVDNFTFSNPINAEESIYNTSDSSSHSVARNVGSTSFSAATTSMPNFIWSGSSTAPRLKAKVKSSKDGLVGSVRAHELKPGSVIDILCPKSNKIEFNLIGQPNSELISEAVCTDKTSTLAQVGTFSDIKSTRDVESSWECSECLIRNSSIDEQCTACKVTRLNPDDKTTSPSTSTAEIVVESKPVADNNFGSQFKLSTNQWECTICCVRNKQSDIKCVACTALKPGSSSVTQQPIKSQNDLMEKFKPAEGSWECPGCLLRNAADVITCPCCNASNPVSVKVNSKKTNTVTEVSSAQSTANTESTVTQGTASNISEIMNKFKPSKDSWECSGCLVRNNNSVTTCPCCNTSKPDSVGEPSKIMQTSTNGFGDKFKKPEGAWICDSCLLQNDARHIQCVACQASKPGTTKSDESVLNTNSTLQFNFGVPSSTTSLTTDQPGGFKFGIDKTDNESKSDTASPLNGFKFGNTQQNCGIAQFTFGVPKEENKAANEATKTNGITTSSGSTGFLFKAKTEKSDCTNQDQEAKQEISFNVPKSESLVTTDEKQNTSVTTIVTTSAPSFTFGMQKPEFNVTNNEAQKTSFTTKEVSSSMSLFNNNSEPKTTIAFGTDKPSAFTATVSKPSAFTISENKVPTFGSNTESKPAIFGTSETKLPVFNPPAANPLPTFVSPSSSATPSLFGSSSTPAFGNTTLAFGGATTTPAIFSSTKPSETNTVSSSSLFTFGSASSQQSTSGGFNFSANVNPPASSAKPLFTFGSNSNTPQSNNNTFGSGTFAANSAPTNTANFTFNPSKQETPAPFNQQSAIATPMFGSPQANPQTQVQATSSFSTLSSTPSSSTTFNFGSTAQPAAASGGFNFGGMSSTSTTTGGFNFNPPTSTPSIAFDPNSRPSFNFTKGSAPTSFNAPPQSAAAPRKIKKAFRRCMR